MNPIASIRRTAEKYQQIRLEGTRITSQGFQELGNKVASSVKNAVEVNRKVATPASIEVSRKEIDAYSRAAQAISKAASAARPKVDAAAVAVGTAALVYTRLDPVAQKVSKVATTVGVVDAVGRKDAKDLARTVTGSLVDKAIDKGAQSKNPATREVSGVLKVVKQAVDAVALLPRGASGPSRYGGGSENAQ